MQSSNKLDHFLMVLAAAMVAHRLLVIFYGSVPIDLEEAYYSSWRDTLDWGYYSKPPLLPYSLYLVTSVFGETYIALKLFSLCLYTLSAVFVGMLGGDLFGKRLGLISAVVFLSLPFVAVLSFAATTDAPLVLFWASGIWVFNKALSDKRVIYWLILGLIGGFGMLSKFTFALLPVGILCFLTLSKHRQVFFEKGLWLSLLTAVIVWMPNLLWMSDHNWITLAHTKDISGVTDSVINFDTATQFLAEQFVVFGPLTMGATLAALFALRSTNSSKNMLLLCVSLPLLLTIVIQSFRSDANMNWAVPSYIGLTLLASVMANKQIVFLFLLLFSNLAISSTIIHYDFLTKDMVFERKLHTDPFYRQRGWEELGEKTSKLLVDFPNAKLLSSDRDILAYLRFHQKSSPKPKVALWKPDGKWTSQYAIHQNISQSPDGEFIWLSREKLSNSELSHFVTHSEMGEVSVDLVGRKPKVLFAYMVADFKGY